MRTCIIAILTFCSASFSYSQTASADNFFPMYDSPKTAMFYISGENGYLRFYLAAKPVFDGKEYYPRVTAYSWGSIDTAYFREDSANFYNYDPDIQKESVVLPKRVTVGQKWFEADSSWSYEVLGINEKLKTPAKKYTNLILLECLQLTNRDKNKITLYHLYFAEGIGMVASANKVKLISYLSQIKVAESEGDRIGR